jgi:nitroimidazol reductase NimA-like FMN-containing flavoprotein (pyridoxamine 5'-phosphate oxidase superfamily)
MNYIPAGTEVLTAEECWKFLESSKVGRLAIDIAGKPDIFPINFIVDDGSLVFQTGAGTKFAASALLHHVAFEIDGYEPQQRTAWSVVVKGRAHQIERMQDVFAAQDLPLFPWAAHPKPNFVKISPTEITGRRFHIVDHVSPDTSIGWQADQQPTSGDAVVPGPGAEFHPGAPNVRPG